MAAEPSPVRQALYDRLSSDAELTALLAEPGYVFHRMARQGSAPPYLIFNRISGPELLTFGTTSETPLWLVKGVCKGKRASEEAESIDARAKDLLHKAQLTLPGGTLTILRESAVDYGEDATDGTHWEHVGSLYRLFT